MRAAQFFEQGGLFLMSALFSSEVCFHESWLEMLLELRFSF